LVYSSGSHGLSPPSRREYIIGPGFYLSTTTRMESRVNWWEALLKLKRIFTALPLNIPNSAN